MSPGGQVVYTPIQVVPEQYQVVKIEQVVGEIVGGGTGAVMLRGGDAHLPLGAVLIAPSGSSTAA